MNPSYVSFFFIGVFVLGAIYFYIKSITVKKAVIEWEEPKDFCLLTIKVPKENEKTPFAAEQMFASLHGMFKEGATEQPFVSFEMVSKRKAIQFFIYIERNLKEFIISQIYAQYPEVEVDEIEFAQDYVYTVERGELAATELMLKRETAFPIKTFQNFDVDPLSSITGVLSSIREDEEIWIQTIVKPADDSWQDMGIKSIKNVKEPSKGIDPWSVVVLQKVLRGLKYFVVHVVTGSHSPDEVKEPKPKELTGPEQQAIKGIEEKITKMGFNTQIRIAALSSSEIMARSRLEQTIAAYKQYNTLNQNGFVFKEITSDTLALELFKNRTMGESDMIFNTTELASLYHFPSKSVSTPTIVWAGSKRGEPPSNLPVLGAGIDEDLTVLAKTNYRNEMRKFGIKQVDRRLHMYNIGKTGTGKSTIMENMIIDDIAHGRGVAVVDPHGETIKHVLQYIPESRINDVVYFNPADGDYPLGFNLLENVNPEYKNIVASGVVGVFKKIFGESWGPRLEYILRNTVLALLEYPGSTLLGVMRLLTDTAYRRTVINEVKDPVIRDFFVNEYEKYDPKFRTEAIAPIQNKVGQFLSSSIVRNIVGQPKSTMDIRSIMDESKILLVDLSTGKIGEDNSSLLGSMLITRIQLAAMSRANVEESQRPDFYLFVDEFQNFATDSFATILSEARKYHLCLALTNQYIHQLSDTVANAVFGNVGTTISFRVSSSDAQVLEKEFEPIFTANDMVNLSNYHIYIKMAINGVTTPAFSAQTLPRPEITNDLTPQIIEASRRNFARRREDVEDYISEWSEPIELNKHSETPSRPVYKPQAEGDRGVIEKPVAVEPAVVEVPPTVSEPVETKEMVYKKLPEKMEILKDRFGRPWFAISQAGESQPAEVESYYAAPQPTEQSGGELVREQGSPVEEEVVAYEEPADELVTLDQISAIGVDNPDHTEKPDLQDKNDDLQPINEL